MSCKKESHGRNWQRYARAAAISIAVVGACTFANVAPSFGQDPNGLPQVMSGDAATAFREGIKQLHANDNVNAVASLTRAATLAPQASDIHHFLGLALAKTGQVKQAIEEMKMARNLNPSSAAAWLSLGGLYQTQGQVKDAIATFREFLKRFPNDRDAAKIANLVVGLEKEKFLEAPSSTEDYFSEITRDGLVRWSAQKMPLRVYIAPGNTVIGYKPQYLDILKKSFADWAQVSNGLVNFLIVEDPLNSDIEVTWSSDPTSFKNIAEAGETRVTTSSKRGLIKGTIKFLTVPLVKDLPLTDARMRTICLHEIGHVLGMAGHTSNPEDCMFYSVAVSDAWKDLTARDANTLIRLYSLPAVAPQNTQNTTNNPTYNIGNPAFVR